MILDAIMSGKIIKPLCGPFLLLAMTLLVTSCPARSSGVDSAAALPSTASQSAPPAAAPPEAPSPVAPPPKDAPATSPTTVESPHRRTFAAAEDRRAFEHDLRAGDLIAAEDTAETFDSWSAAATEAGELDRQIESLEQAVLTGNTPPTLHFALAVLYGKKGLVAKEYAALTAAEATAKAQPGLAFNLAVIYGRKKMLESGYTVEQLIPGSLRIDAQPAGARVRIAGQDQGIAPLTVELMAGTYRLRLDHDDYRGTETDAAVKPGVETLVRLELEPLPARLTVQTNPPGAQVRMDGAGEARQTPFEFQNLRPGPHTLAVEYLLEGDKYYGLDDPLTIALGPGETKPLLVQLTPRQAHFTISGAEGSSLMVNGSPVYSPALATEGVTVDAGKLDLRLRAANGQEWTFSGSLYPQTDRAWDRGNLVQVIPRRAITLDGKTDDWQDLIPTWTALTIQDKYPNQAGTAVRDWALCRDDRYLYLRAAFADGSPTSRFSADIAHQVSYQWNVFLNNDDMLLLEVGINKTNGTYAAAIEAV